MDPVGTAERLMARDMPVISGNHDRWLIDRPAEEQPLWEQWTLPKLSAEHLDWIRSMPARREVGEVLMTHGTPASDTENWLHVRSEWGGMRPARLDEVAPKAGDEDFPVILSGHTHFPRIVRLPDGRLLMNPGAVGCPAYLDTRTDPPIVAETGAPDARYGVIERHDGRWQASLRVVPYDPSEMVSMAREMGAEDWVIPLTTGWARSVS